MPVRINSNAEKSCKIDGCSNVRQNRTLCRKHSSEASNLANKKYREREKELQTDGEAYCYKCDKSLSVSEFNRDRTRPNGLTSKCRICANEFRILKQFRLTSIDIRCMLEDQEYKCKICFKDFESGKWHIDHDHACCDELPTCGKCTRGLLCNRCNWALGHLGDSEQNLYNAITYLGDYNRRS